MNVIDFIIGLSIANSLPHFLFGTWRVRMLSGLGFGNKANIAYSLINFIIGIALYSYKYGLSSLLENGILLGVLFVIVVYFIVGRICFIQFHEKYYKKNKSLQDA